MLTDFPLVMQICTVFFHSDAAIFKQFEKYLLGKSLVPSQLDADSLRKEGVQFMRHSYPGARRPPNELVKTYNVSMS